MPQTQERTNGQRVTRILRAIEDYGRTDLHTGLIDAVTDLMHLCHAKGLDFCDIVLMAEIHFDEEKERVPPRWRTANCVQD